MHSQVILILIGWFMGVLNTVGYELYKGYLDGKRLKTAILSELKELLPRLVLTYYALINKTGDYNKENVQWVYDNLSSYEDKSKTLKIESLKEKLGKLLEQNDIIIKSIINSETAETEVEHIKSINLSFNKESIEKFSLLSEELRLIIFDVRTKVNIMNELADIINFYFKQTFVPGMPDKNHEIIVNNIISNYKTYIMQNKIVVERIKEIFELEKDKTA